MCYIRVFIALCIIATMIMCDSAPVPQKSCCKGPISDKDNDSIMDGDYIESVYREFGDTLSETKRQEAIKSGRYDTFINCVQCE